MLLLEQLIQIEWLTTLLPILINNNNNNNSSSNNNNNCENDLESLTQRALE